MRISHTSLKLTVSSERPHSAECPEMRFMPNNSVLFSLGSDLCSYDVQPDTYSSHTNRTTKCPTLPVHPRYSMYSVHVC